MKIVITGGCGFIGRALVSYLLKNVDNSNEIFLIDTMHRHGGITDSNITLSPNALALYATALPIRP